MVAVVAVSGLVGLQVSTRTPARRAPTVERKVLGLKERQLTEHFSLVSGGDDQATPQVAASPVASAEQMIVGEQRPGAARQHHGRCDRM